MPQNSGWPAPADPHDGWNRPTIADPQGLDWAIDQELKRQQEAARPPSGDGEEDDGG